MTTTSNTPQPTPFDEAAFMARFAGRARLAYMGEAQDIADRLRELAKRVEEDLAIFDGQTDNFLDNAQRVITSANDNAGLRYSSLVKLAAEAESARREAAEYAHRASQS